MILFQTWRSSTNLPSDFYYWRSTWLKNHPDWHHVLWDDNDNRRFIATHFPWFLTTYDAYDVGIKRVDVVRYFFLYTYGGVYADLDFECLKPLDNSILDPRYDVILGSMDSFHSSNFWYRDNSIPNAFIVSKKGAPFWRFVFHKLMTQPFAEKPEIHTGPVFLYYCIQEYSQKHLIKILSPSLMYPINWTTFQKKLPTDLVVRTAYIRSRFPDAYAVTYWKGTWKK